MKTKNNIPSIIDLKPRVRIEWNTGTRIIKSKKDKARSRAALKKALRDEF